MKDNYKWLKRFYQDLCQQQTRYELTAEPLCFAINYDDDIEQNKDHLVRKVTDLSPVSISNENAIYAYYQNSKLIQDYQQLPQPKPAIDEYFEANAVGNLIVDDDFLVKYHENSYRTVILDGVQDYVLNYYPKFIKDNSSYVRDLPISCLVFVKPDGSYFYAVPMSNDRKFTLYHAQTSKSIPGMADDIRINPSEHSQPIIKTTIANILHILDAQPLAKVPIVNSLAETDNPHFASMIIFTSSLRSIPFVHDDRGNKFLTYKYFQMLNPISYYYNNKGQLFNREELSNYSNVYHQYPNPMLEAKFLNVGSDADLFDESDSSAQFYLLRYMKGHFDQNGEVYYTLDGEFGNETWNKLLRHLGTQNVLHYLFGAITKNSTYAYWQNLTHNDWSNFTNEQVEDLPLQEVPDLQPLTEPTGLNKLIIDTQIGQKHTCFINHNQLMQLNINHDYGNSIKIRRCEL